MFGGEQEMDMDRNIGTAVAVAAVMGILLFAPFFQAISGQFVARPAIHDERSESVDVGKVVNNYQTQTTTDHSTDRFKSLQERFGGPSVIERFERKMEMYAKTGNIEYMYNEPLISQRSSTRTRADGDAWLEKIEYSIINYGWAKVATDDPSMPGNQGWLGSFEVGKATTISVTVRNNGTTPLNNVYVNFTIMNLATNEPPVYHDNSTLSAPIGAGDNATKTYTWTPQYCSTYGIIAEVYVAGDPNSDNNAVGYFAWTSKWSEDFSAGDSALSDWQGDKGADEWHVTNTPANALSPYHSEPTNPNALYCGSDGAVDHYSNDMDSEILTPVFDLSHFNTAFRFYIAYKITGESDDEDKLHLGDVTDDGGQTYENIFTDDTIYGSDFNAQWYFLMVDGANPGIPLYYYDGIDDWSHVQYRMRFVSDSGTVPPTKSGFYLDDFIIYGIEVPHDIYAEEVNGYEGPNDVGSPVSFGVKVKNVGLNAESDITVYANITFPDGTVGANLTKTITSIAQGQEQSTTFQFTPTMEGKYRVDIHSAQELDMVPYNDDLSFDLWAFEPATDVLIVDDDNSYYTNGGPWAHDVASEVMEALNYTTYKYNVYTMLQDENAPSATLLSKYDVVIWVTGSDYDLERGKYNEVLSTADENALKTYLNGGGNFILFSQGYLYEVFGMDTEGNLNEGATQQGTFVRDYLHVESGDVAVNYTLMESVLTGIGSPWDQHDLTMEWPDDLYDIPCTIQPMDDASGIYTASQEANYSAVAYAGNYKSIFFTVPFAALKQSDQMTFIDVAMKWFKGGLQFSTESADASAKPYDTVSYTLNIKNEGFETDTVTLQVSGPAEYVTEFNFTGDSVDVPPQATAKVMLNVTVPGPDTALHGDVVTFNVSATSSKVQKTYYVDLTLSIEEYKDLKITASGPDSGSGEPGDTVQFSFKAKADCNNLSKSYNVALEAEADDAMVTNWLSLDKESLTLTGGADDTVTLTVEIPDELSEAKPGTYNISVTGTIDSTPAKQPLIFTLTVEEVTHPGVNVTLNPESKNVDMSQYSSADEGKNETFTLTITNTGESNLPEGVDTYELTVPSIPAGWSVDFQIGAEYNNSVVIKFGESKSVTVNVRIPGNAEEDQDLAIVVTSQTDASVTAQVTAHINIMRPDISFESVTLTQNGENATKLEVGKEYTVSVVVKNTGEADATNFKVQVALTDPDGNPVYLNKTVTVPSGGEQTVTFKWTPEKSGEYKLGVNGEGTGISKSAPSNILPESGSLQVKKKETTSGSDMTLIIALVVVIVVVVVVLVVVMMMKKKKTTPPQQTGGPELGSEPEQYGQTPR